MEFKCFNGVGHGKVDLEKAIAYSCNGYFIKLTEQMKPEELLSMAEKLGFGSSVELAPGMSSSAGNLPVKKDLSNPKAKANFSFGQGDLAGYAAANCRDGQYHRQRRAVYRTVFGRGTGR